MKAKKGLALGVFDVFHIGHLRYLEYAANHCEELTVGIRGDDLATPGKNRKTLFNERIRKELVSGLRCVCESFVFHELLDNASHWSERCRKHKINIVFVGAEWKDSQRWKKLEKSLQRHNIDVAYVRRTDDISTTMILDSIKLS